MSGRLKISIVILALLYAASVQAFEANEGAISMEDETKKDEHKKDGIIEKDTIHDKINPDKNSEKKKKKKSKSQQYYEDLDRQKRYFEEQTKGFVMDLRTNTKFEKTLRWAFYLPLSAIYFLVCVISAILSLYYSCKLICRKSDPSEKEIEKVDNISINPITLEKLTELNQKREDDKLSFGSLMIVYNFLNLRTEFMPDDVFSQQSAIFAFQQNVKANTESYTDSQVIVDEDVHDGFKRMTKEGKTEINKTRKFQRAIYIMCYLSMVATCLALVQIFANLWEFTRILVLSQFDNALLRICFGIIILFITYRDSMQILINLGLRITGAVGPASRSRFMFFETILRMGVTLLACLAILFTIFSSPKDDEESIIDQTMNFTALVVLLEIDNILAGVFQKKIDKLEIEFEYHKDTIEFEFNRAADFLVQREKLMPCQSVIEKAVVVFIIMILYLVVTFVPIFLMLVYIVQPIPDTAVPAA